MDERKLQALVKKNMAKAAKSSATKNFGKRYDQNLPDLPTDEASLKKQEELDRLFAEMKKREF
jgi:hypothetical protein